MQITQLPNFSSKCINLSVERDNIRNPGLHLSAIIKDRLITIGVERRVKGAQFTPDEQHLVFQRGFLWERMCEEFCNTEQWLQREIDSAASRHFATGQLEVNSDPCIVRPGECQLDGIYLTPDAIHIMGGHIEEWKATAMRYRGFSIQDRRPEWLWQAAAYAQVFGMTKAAIRVWHVSDNVINPMLIEWTPEEVSMNWKLLLDHRELMRRRNEVSSRG